MRGVYQQRTFSDALREGSSPHARGLRTIRIKVLPAERIIPACAGFTTEFNNSRSVGLDHPRMRGVYAVFSVGAA